MKLNPLTPLVLFPFVRLGELAVLSRGLAINSTSNQITL